MLVDGDVDIEKTGPIALHYLVQTLFGGAWGHTHEELFWETRVVAVEAVVHVEIELLEEFMLAFG